MSDETLRSAAPPAPLPCLAAIGYSARSLVEAIAAVAGPPLAFDAFADADCRRASWKCTQLVRWGKAQTDLTPLLDQLQMAGNPPILLAGGTENWPELTRQLSRSCTVLGPSLQQLTRVRDPAFWQQSAIAAGLGFPESLFIGMPLRRNAHSPNAATWLVKPRRGAGGIGIRVQHAGTPPQTKAASDSYWQRHVRGRSLGAHCLLGQDHPYILGVTESWTADDWPGPGEFHYRGSWGPVTIPPPQRKLLEQLCEIVQSETGLVGWIQFDLIEEPSGKLWLLEINPRWAAGMEILWRAGVANPVRPHLQAYGLERLLRNAGRPPVAKQAVQTGVRQCAKAVLYAPMRMALSIDQLSELHNQPDCSDVPYALTAETIIEAGHPLLTLRAEVRAAAQPNDAAAVRRELLEWLSRRRTQVLRLLSADAPAELAPGVIDLR